MGILNLANYKVVSVTGAHVATTGIFILASDLYLHTTFANSEGATIDVFLHYDMKVIIQDGVLTVSV